MSQMIDLTKTTAYDYLLPKELIAQDPAEPRDSSRLLLVDRGTSRLEDHVFRDIISCLQPQDLLVLNDTKVLPARLEGVKKYGGAKVEIFFLRPDGDEKNRWISMVKPGRKLPEGTVVTLNDQFEVTVGARLEDGLRTIEFHAGDDPLAKVSAKSLAESDCCGGFAFPERGGRDGGDVDILAIRNVIEPLQHLKSYFGFSVAVLFNFRGE